MNFLELVNKVNDLNNEQEINEIIENIDINWENFDNWIDNIFGEKINSFNMEKLPYLIDGLYKSNEKIKFMLCCMLLESTYDKLAFITNLENYPLFEEKLKTIIHTLVTVYDAVDNSIAYCMSLIILKNDPKFSYFDEQEKDIIKEATKRKLKDILEHLKKENVNPIVYSNLEVIVDMSCYLNDNEINKLIDEIDNLGDNKYADVFIIKYKIINNQKIVNDKINNIIKNDSKDLCILYELMEKLNMNNVYLKDVTQEMIAKSDMIRCLEYTTELGSLPDKIELLGEFILDNEKFYAFKFSKEDFKIKGDLIGVSGGYPLDFVTSNASGFTFSQFEQLTNNWQEQAKKIVNLIKDYWKNRANNQD